MAFERTTYIVNGQGDGIGPVTLHGIEALARYEGVDLYTVTGLNGRALTEAEIVEWERLSDLYAKQGSVS